MVCTDPVLSQAIAKGPFSDNFVRRPLREFISCEAGGNDGFGFPFLLLAVALLRYADMPANKLSLKEFDLVRGPQYLVTAGAGRFGGGVGRALAHWVIEGVLYMIVLGVIYGGFIGIASQKILNFASKRLLLLKVVDGYLLTLVRRWVDPESYLLIPVAIGVSITILESHCEHPQTGLTRLQVFIVGSCGCIGTDETVACFTAGCTLNWDGSYHAETQTRHDSFNPTIETGMNSATFIFLGTVMPWDQFHMPEDTGLTILRLVGLGFLMLVFRRIPVVLMGYRFMPKVCRDWKEALFLGYFGPIGRSLSSLQLYGCQLVMLLDSARCRSHMLR